MKKRKWHSSDVIAISDDDDVIEVSPKKIPKIIINVDEEVFENKSISSRIKLPARLLNQHISPIEFEDHFTSISEYLFNNVILYVNGGRQRCRILEVEFYLTTQSDIHPDPFTHCHPLHGRHAQWYFHQSVERVNDHNFREGTRKGLDITFGQEKSHFGGILIRSMEEINTKNENNKKLMDGPSLCVDYIMDKNNVKCLRELMTKFPNSRALEIDCPSDFNNYPVHLSEYNFEKKYKVLSGSRVGLSLLSASKQYVRSSFVLKQYRFYAHPVKVNKNKNQMVASMYIQEMKKKIDFTKVGCVLLKDAKLINHISNVLCCSIKFTQHCVDLVLEGYKKSIVKKHDGTYDIENMQDYFANTLTPNQVIMMHGVLFPLI
ncbi:hypothetical protein AKO1_000334 [Acrasis kona]|uniref:Uncharacterized protein n=1 Tax=Acrasis kona TaxID=1008807 RepID=A0AAW2ZCE5_9EUKA